VRKSNVRAQDLYKSFGFFEVGRRKNYYLEPLEDALVMKKTIDLE
jgi:ribosomal-protein-alanine N-acetyltransferase